MNLSNEQRRRAYDSRNHKQQCSLAYSWQGCPFCSHLYRAHGGTMLEALRAFYSSKMYHELEDESTKLWHLGPVALYEDFEKEN